MYGIPGESQVLYHSACLHERTKFSGVIVICLRCHILISPLVWHARRLTIIIPMYVPRCPVSLLAVTGAEG